MRRERRWWSLAAALGIFLWMLVIFCFSAQPDTESAEVSGRVTYRIVEGVNDALHLELTEKQITERAEAIELPVRKMAHMTEYAVLAVLFLAAVHWGDERKRRGRLFCCAAALGLAVLYACSDEFHQRFVPGRAGRVTDVLIDACGAFLGLLVVFLFANCYNRKKKKKG